MSKDNEHVLVRRSTSCSIDKWLYDICVVHVEVTAKDTPKNALKGLNPSAVDRTSNKPM